MAASRALLAVAARSLAAVDDEVTLPQYRALVVMAERGTQRPVDLATAMDVSPSTATRMCDRLVAKSLVVRDRIGVDRREVRVGLSRRGRQLVDAVMDRRRAELAVLLAKLPVKQQEAVADVLRAFAEVAGEVPEREWAVRM